MCRLIGCSVINKFVRRWFWIIKLFMFKWHMSWWPYCPSGLYTNGENYRVKWARELISCAQIPVDTTRSVYRRLRWRDTYTQNLHLYFKINSYIAEFIPWHIFLCSSKNGVGVMSVGWVRGSWTQQHGCDTSTRRVDIQIYVDIIICGYIDISIQMNLCLHACIYIIWIPISEHILIF